MRYGLKGSAYAGYFPFSTRSQMGMMNGSASFGFEKISYYISANGILQDIGINSTMKRVAGTTNINQHSDIGMKVGMGNVNVGLIYDPDELNDINLNIAYNNMSEPLGSGCLELQSNEQYPQHFQKSKQFQQQK